MEGAVSNKVFLGKTVELNCVLLLVTRGQSSVVYVGRLRFFCAIVMILTLVSQCLVLASLAKSLLRCNNDSILRGTSDSQNDGFNKKFLFF